MPLLDSLTIAALAAVGVGLIAAGLLRWRRRGVMRRRVSSLDLELSDAEHLQSGPPWRSSTSTHRALAARLGSRVAARFPSEIGALATRVDRAGLTGGVATVELLGWKVLCAIFGCAVGVWFIVKLGPIGLVMLVLCVLIGWFGIDVMLSRYHSVRRRAILRDLPTVMDLLVLSLEAGMGLDRALRTVIHEYRSALSEEIQRVLRDIDLGISRGEAFERMAQRVGLDDLQSLSRAIIQSEQLGVSLVNVMHVQSREVRLSRRRAAEAEALRAPIKMVVPLVLFILPTLFMLLLGPVGLRAAAALGGLR
jgi:tight adherence protein C